MRTSRGEDGHTTEKEELEEQKEIREEEEEEEDERQSGPISDPSVVAICFDPLGLADCQSAGCFSKQPYDFSQAFAPTK